jgi:hypothetical protein
LGTVTPARVLFECSLCGPQCPLLLMLIGSLDSSQPEGSESQLLLTPKVVLCRPLQRQDCPQAGAQGLLGASPAAVTDKRRRCPEGPQIVEAN